MVETIQRTFRSTYIVATLKRDEMRRECRKEEMKGIVENARGSQASLVETASKPVR